MLSKFKTRALLCKPTTFIHSLPARTNQAVRNFWNTQNHLLSRFCRSGHTILSSHVPRLIQYNLNLHPFAWAQQLLKPFPATYLKFVTQLWHKSNNYKTCTAIHWKFEIKNFRANKTVFTITNSFYDLLSIRKRKKKHPSRVPSVLIISYIRKLTL